MARTLVRHPGSLGVGSRPDRSIGGMRRQGPVDRFDEADEKGGGVWDLIAEALWGTSSGPQTGKEALNEAGMVGLAVLSGGASLAGGSVLPQLPALAGRTIPFLRGIPGGVSAGLAPRAAVSPTGLPGRLVQSAAGRRTENLAALAAMLATERGRESFRHPMQTHMGRGAALGLQYIDKFTPMGPAWDWLTGSKDPSAPWYEIW